MNPSFEENLPPIWDTPEPQKPSPEAGKRELILAAVTLPVALLLINCLFFGGVHLGFAIALLLTLSMATVYLLRCGHRGDGYSWALLALSVLILPGFARGDDGFVKFVLLCFLFVSCNLGLTGLAGKRRYPTAVFSSLGDVFCTAFGLGFGHMTPALRGISNALKNGSPAAKKGGAVLLGLAMSIPVLAIMIPLLMQADAAFEGLLNLLPEIKLYEILLTVLFGAVTAIILYARNTGLVHAKHTPAQAVAGKKLSPVTMNTLLAMVCVLYSVYLLSQLAYFSGGFSGILPQGYSLAEYARRGFFEMGWLCAINLSVMLLGIGLARKKNGNPPLSTRLLCLFIGLVTLFLVAASGAKMVLYIGSYGMTRLRILTMVIIGFLGLTTALVCTWLFLPKLPYMRILVICALVIGAAVLWADVNSVVAAYNVDAYLSGTLETVDVEYLGELGGAAVPHLLRLYQESDSSTPVTLQAASMLSRLAHETYFDDFRDWNYVNYIANRITTDWEKGIR